MPHHLTPLLALGAGLTLALSGCSAGLTRPAAAPSHSVYTPDNAAGGSLPSTSTDTSTSPTPSSATLIVPDAPVPTVSGGTSTLAGTGASPAATSSPAAAPLAGADFDRNAVGGTGTVHLRFDVMGLTRQGQLLQLAARITSLDPIPAGSGNNPSYLTWSVDGLSDTSRSTQLIPTSGIGVAYSGTTLIDVAAKKRYLVAVDSRGTCLCTADLYQNYSIGPGQSLTLNATYAAPPTTTTKLDVDVPGIGDFADVPIS